MAGKASSAIFVSCRHTTSGDMSASHASRRGRRAFRELTFQVATRTLPTVPATGTVGSVRVTVWSDYICPWCYLALPSEELLGELGVEVTIRPFELHPDTPVSGRHHRPAGRTATALAAVGEQCRAAGLPFRAPTRTPNSRRALESAEQVRLGQPEVFWTLHRSLFAAHFVDGRDIGDQEVIDDLVVAAGGRPPGVGGSATTSVDRSITEAREHGVTATPTFVFVDHDLVVPGTHPPDTLRRWVTRLQDRSDEG